jgi:hypothetical protein
MSTDMGTLATTLHMQRLHAVRFDYSAGAWTALTS